MSEWKETKIKDFGKVITGYTPPTHNLKLWIGEIPFYSPADFNDDVYCSITERVVAPEALSNDRIVQKNSLMVTCIASIGKIALAERKGVSNQQINTIIFNENFDSKYCYYLIKYHINELLKLAGTTAVPIVNKAEFEKIVLKHHSETSTQRKIAHILSTADAVIEKTRAAIAKYKAIKQGMLHDLFTCGIDLNTGKLRPKYEDAPELFKKSKLGWIPKVWEEKNLEFFTTQIGDGIHTTPKYSENTDYYFVNGNNLSDGKIIIGDTALCVSLEEFKKHFIELNKRTILYSINGTIGNIAFYNGEKIILGKSACYITCRNNVNLDFIYFFLQSFQVNKFYEIELTGSTIKNLSLASIRNTPITIPKDETEQKLISDKLLSIVNKIQTEQTYLHKLQQIKAGLMADLLSGRKEVIVDEEELTETEN